MIISRIVLFLLLLIVISTNRLFAQNTQNFALYEDSLKSLAKTIGLDSIQENREKAVKLFIPYLVQTLKQKASFSYPFDSVKGVSFVYAPDSAFRMITLQMKRDDGSNRYYGAIQMNSSAGLQLIPLFDVSDTLGFQCNKVLSPKTWYGAVYYNILKHESDGQDIYTLFGYDANDFWSNKKFIEILTFKDGQAVFGAPMINVTDSLGNTKTYNRFFIEYKHDSKVGLNYYPEQEMIVYDHLKPYRKKYEGLYFTYIPDGSYEGFKWDEGGWNWIKKVFHFSIGKNDDPPMPNPILDGEDEKLYDPKSQRSQD